MVSCGCPRLRQYWSNKSSCCLSPVGRMSRICTNSGIKKLGLMPQFWFCTLKLLPVVFSLSNILICLTQHETCVFLFLAVMVIQNCSVLDYLSFLTGIKGSLRLCWEPTDGRWRLNYSSCCVPRAVFPQWHWAGSYWRLAWIKISEPRQ